MLLLMQPHQQGVYAERAAPWPACSSQSSVVLGGRANLLGLSNGVGTDGGTVFAEPCEVKGDVALIGGRPWPADVQARREPLLRRTRREGFAHTLEYLPGMYCASDDEATIQAGMVTVKRILAEKVNPRSGRPAASR